MTRMRPNVLLAVLVLLALSAGVAFAEYDKAKVQGVMRANMGALPRLNTAANAGNFVDAAGALLTISSGMFSIKDYTPLKGDKAAWDATFATLLEATWRGLAACADKNQANLKAAVAEVQKAMQAGHSSFR